MQIAIIGYGYWGRNVLKALQKTKLKIKTIFDIDPIQMANAKKLCDYKIYNSYEAILSDKEIQAVFIITPPQTHYELALKALQNKKHIFVEKPLCLDYLEAKHLFDLAKKQNLVLHIDHVFLYSSAVNWMKYNLSCLGEALYISARRLNLGLFQQEVNVIWDLAIHDLSIIDFLFGLNYKNLQVFSKKFANYQNDALASIKFELDPEIFINIEVSWLSPLKVREMIIGGSEGTLIYDETKSKKITFFDSGIIIHDSQNLYEKMVQYKIGKISNPDLESSPLPLDKSIAHFIKKINLKEFDIQHKDHVLRVTKMLLDIAKCVNPVN